MIEFENDYLHVWIDRSIDLMHSEWLRNVSSEEYKQGNATLLKLLEKYDIKFWIADSAKLGDISLEDQEWSMLTLVPQIAGSGIKKLARIAGGDRVSYNKFETFAEKAAALYVGDMEVRQFLSYKEAADWVGEIHT